MQPFLLFFYSAFLFLFVVPHLDLGNGEIIYRDIAVRLRRLVIVGVFLGIYMHLREREIFREEIQFILFIFHKTTSICSIKNINEERYNQTVDEIREHASDYRYEKISLY